MGDRYILAMHCPNCGYLDEEIWYAPSCGSTQWSCPYCKSHFEIREKFVLVEIKTEKASEP